MKDFKPAHWVVIIVIILCFAYFLIKSVDTALVAVVVGAMHFFTGTTTGSQSKDETIADIAKNGTNTINQPTT